MNPRAIALQGIGFGPLLVAVQGFAPFANFIGGVGGSVAARQRTAARISRGGDEDELIWLAAAALTLIEDIE